jgi:hemolysin type calcium-binding protein
MISKRLCSLPSLALLAPALAAGAIAPPDQNHGLRGTARYDRGLYVAFCPRSRGDVHGAVGPTGASVPSRRGSEAPGAYAPEPPGAQEGSAGAETAGAEAQEAAPEHAPKAAAASTSEAGWPAKECLKMDKGAAGRGHTLVGLNAVHNWLLGGYGNDTIIGGDHGDVIWADYHPSGEPRSQSAQIRAGNGRNVIYANDTHNYVWTGSNPRTVVHAHVSGISGVIHCQSAGVVVYLSTVSERRFELDGCRHISHYSVGY